MAILVHYAKADGRMLGVWQAATATLLEAQVGEASAETGYQQVETEVPLPRLIDEYYLQAGMLVAKQVLTLTATPRPVVAHATPCWEVTVTPFVPCTLLVDGIPYALTEEDQTLELVSHEPHTFVLTLAPMAQARTEPLSVEAS